MMIYLSSNLIGLRQIPCPKNTASQIRPHLQMSLPFCGQSLSNSNPSWQRKLRSEKWNRNWEDISKKSRAMFPNMKANWGLNTKVHLCIQDGIGKNKKMKKSWLEMKIKKPKIKIKRYVNSIHWFSNQKLIQKLNIFSKW